MAAPNIQEPDRSRTNLIPSPEEEECERKLGELAEAEQLLARAEADLEKIRGELRAFEEEYLRVVKPCITEMEELQTEAEKIEQEIDDALKGAGCTTTAQQGAFCEPGEMKDLFREVARNIHPDLARTEPERQRRDIAMAEANEAYANGDPEKLRRLLQDWKADPDAIKGDDVGSRLIRLIRQVARAKNRTAEVKREMQEIRGSDLYFLKLRSERATHEGRDLLVEMRKNLEDQLAQQRTRVEAMHVQQSTASPQ